MTLIDLGYFYIVCGICVISIFWGFFSYKKLRDNYDYMAMVLGYYALRFGEVSDEDVINLIGVDKDKLR